MFDGVIDRAYTLSSHATELMHPSDTIRGSVFLGLGGVHEGLIAIRLGELFFAGEPGGPVDRDVVRYRC